MMDDFGNAIRYSHWSDEGFGRLEQLCGTAACFGFCTDNYFDWINAARRQVI